MELANQVTTYIQTYYPASQGFGYKYKNLTISGFDAYCTYTKMITSNVFNIITAIQFNLSSSGTHYMAKAVISSVSGECSYYLYELSGNGTFTNATNNTMSGSLILDIEIHKRR